MFSLLLGAPIGTRYKTAQYPKRWTYPQITAFYWAWTQIKFHSIIITVCLPLPKVQPRPSGPQKQTCAFLEASAKKMLDNDSD